MCFLLVICMHTPVNQERSFFFIAWSEMTNYINSNQFTFLRFRKHFSFSALCSLFIVQIIFHYVQVIYKGFAKYYVVDCSGFMLKIHPVTASFKCYL